MDDKELLILGALAVGAYILIKRPGLTQVPASVRSGAYLTSYPGVGTTAAVPGFGFYRSGPGGTQIALDPSLISRLFPGASPGATMQPNLPYTPADSPVDQPWANLAQVTGGAYDAYRMGERDPAFAPDAVLNPFASADQLLPTDPGGGIEPDPYTFDPCALDPNCYGDYTWMTG